MAVIKRTALVPYSTLNVFDVVNDVNAYSEFLPGCIGSTVFEADEKSMRAELKLGSAGITATFITRNILNRPESIQLGLESGPFKSLKGEWVFHALSESACRVSFELDFSMKNRFTSKAVELLLSKVSGDMVNAVTNELKKRYG